LNPELFLRSHKTGIAKYLKETSHILSKLKYKLLSYSKSFTSYYWEKAPKDTKSFTKICNDFT
jgi:hypothetical protein